MRVWDAATGACRVLTCDAPAVDVAFDPDGRLLAASAADGTVGVWDLRADPPQPLWADKRGGTPARGLAFSADGKRLVHAGADLVAGLVVSRAAATGVEGDRTVLAAGALGAVTGGPGGRLAAAGRTAACSCGRTVSPTSRWSGGTAARAAWPSVPTANGWPRWRPTGRAPCRVWDATRTAGSLRLVSSNGTPTGVAVSPDGARLAATTTTGMVMVWPGRPRRWAARRGARRVAARRASPFARLQPRRAASWRSAAGAEVVVWDVSGDRAVARLAAGGPVREVTFGSGGRLAAATGTAVPAVGRGRRA